MTNRTKDEEITVVLVKVHEALVALTKYIDQMSVKLAGAEAGNKAVAEVVDKNQSANEKEIIMERAKALISHTYGEAQKYTTAVIIGSYGGFFALWAGVRETLPERVMMWSGLLMTISILFFAFFEVFKMTLNSIHFLKGTIWLETPRWFRFLWIINLIFTVPTAFFSVGIMIFSYFNFLYPESF